MKRVSLSTEAPPSSSVRYIVPKSIHVSLIKSRKACLFSRKGRLKVACHFWALIQVIHTYHLSTSSTHLGSKHITPTVDWSYLIRDVLLEMVSALELCISGDMLIHLVWRILVYNLWSYTWLMAILPTAATGSGLVEGVAAYCCALAVC